MTRADAGGAHDLADLHRRDVGAAGVHPRAHRRIDATGSSTRTRNSPSAGLRRRLLDEAPVGGLGQADRAGGQTALGVDERHGASSSGSWSVDAVAQRVQRGPAARVLGGGRARRRRRRRRRRGTRRRARRPRRRTRARRPARAARRGSGRPAPRAGRPPGALDEVARSRARRTSRRSRAGRGRPPAGPRAGRAPAPPGSSATGTQTARRGAGRPAAAASASTIGAHGADALGRDEVEDDLVGVPGADARHRRARTPPTEMRVPGLRAAQPEAMAAHVATVVVGPPAREDRPQAVDRLAHARRAVRPLAVVPARDDRRARRAERDVDLGCRSGRPPTTPPSAIATGLRTPIASGPIFSRRPGCAMADGGGQRDGVEGRHLADPQRAQPGAAGLAARRRAPRRRAGRARTAARPRPRPLTASRCRPAGRAGSRPGSSRDASLTWKCAVAVCASRKRRCSGESS